ncbi:hypothetical protein [Candidatus Clostridium helianthi]|uniref:Uncharacterized protein n=1 Tax=Candidatus Clostridium helianthi TaxID=3381660 RepID=A0ABW8SD06_9CLOT
MENNSIEVAQKQPQVRNYCFELAVNELQEVLVKHNIYLAQFDQVISQLHAKIMRESKIQKEKLLV